MEDTASPRCIQHSSVTQAGAKHRLTENPFPTHSHVSPLFSLYGALPAQPQSQMKPTSKTTLFLTHSLTRNVCVFRYTEQFWKSDTSCVSLCFSSALTHLPGANPSGSGLGLGPHRTAPASWVSDPPAINQSSHNPLPGLMFCQNGSQNSGKLLLTLPIYDKRYDLETA